MNTREQTEALAKLDGWERFEAWESFCGRWYVNTERQSVAMDDYLPAYLTSYDAIIPLLQNQSMDVREAVCKCLGLKHDYCAWISATPTQLAEVLLRATGLWEDPNDTTTVLKGKKYQ